MNIAQILLILAVMAFALTAGIAIANNTREEFKPGKRWFWIVSGLSFLGMLFSIFWFSGDEMVFYLASFACTLIISMVPLGMMRKKKRK